MLVSGVPEDTLGFIQWCENNSVSGINFGNESQRTNWFSSDILPAFQTWQLANNNAIDLQKLQTHAYQD